MTELDDLRAAARAWVAENFPRELAGHSPVMGQTSAADAEALETWKTRLCAQGWGVPTWPPEYGGGGLTTAEARVVREEIRAAGGWNPIGWSMGVRMFGPTLLEYGTEDQKQRHIPPIARGETRWCQGYSEPGAGSDLASLQTRAEDRGDHFLVNGQKIWTSGAQYADWCFCLVRTDASKKHEGISFLMIDMASPGIEVRPIRLISGSSPFCETFFTDVRVPKENLLGPLNGGWTVGKRLLQYERQRSEDAPARPGEGRPLNEVAVDHLGLDASGRLAETDIRRRLTDHLMERRLLRLTMDRAAAESKGAGPSAATSILKNVSSVVNQTRAELLLEIYGLGGLGWEGEGFDPDALANTREWLSGKASTIYAGSYEIQNNIISKRILGLPDPAGAAA
ncbi:acyl-CoA dehydrogenase family protein [Phenylobacterium sp.]|uniref:acyl-CoA dehydrogenase family protein n=1 Tax=Phenylobacterium sp. TaxID=1871053 RepID=UPI003001341D